MKPRPKAVHEEPPVIFVEDEMPMDLYNRAMRQYQDNIGKGLNYQNMHTDLLFRHMQISRPYGYPTYYPYISNWNELWGSMQGGAVGSGARGEDED